MSPAPQLCQNKHGRLAKERKLEPSAAAAAIGSHPDSHQHPPPSDPGIQVSALFRQATWINSSTAEQPANTITQGALESQLSPPQAAHQRRVKMEAIQCRQHCRALCKAGVGSHANAWTFKICILVGTCIKGGRSISVSQSWGAVGHPEGSSFHTCLRMPCLACIHLDSYTFGRCVELIGLISSQNDSMSSGTA